jgi:hypothetical protein
MTNHCTPAGPSLTRCATFGLDQGIGHLRPFRLPPELAAVDAAALAVR